MAQNARLTRRASQTMPAPLTGGRVRTILEHPQEDGTCHGGLVLLRTPELRQRGISAGISERRHDIRNVVEGAPTLAEHHAPSGLGGRGDRVHGSEQGVRVCSLRDRRGGAWRDSRRVADAAVARLNRGDLRAGPEVADDEPRPLLLLVALPIGTGVGTGFGTGVVEGRGDD